MILCPEMECNPYGHTSRLVYRCPLGCTSVDFAGSDLVAQAGRKAETGTVREISDDFDV